MIDVRLLRNDPDAVRVALARRGQQDVLDQLERAIAFDALSRDIIAKRDTIRAEVNELSKAVGQLRRDGDTHGAEELQLRSRSLGDHERVLANEFEIVQGDLRDVLLRIPNVPHPDAPDGGGEVDNPIVKGPIGLASDFPEYRRVPHWDTATALGILDNERATKISGAMFTMQRGHGAALSRALCQYALDRNVDAFEEIRPPSLVTTATLTATGQLPKFADDAYNIERDDLWC
ncbi:MAG: serine--tRNA ligase, partial [Ilumatobacteraceae bacterium]